MTDDDTFAFSDAQLAFQHYSDNELLAFWAATETVPDEVDAISACEAIFIDLAAQELARRDLLPV